MVVVVEWCLLNLVMNLIVILVLVESAQYLIQIDYLIVLKLVDFVVAS